MADIIIKKQPKLSDIDNLEDLSKEELISRIKALQAHNTQLKNIIAKSEQAVLCRKKQQKPFDFTKCAFRHILLKLFYLGWDYQGFATQDDTTKTVEYYVFEALTKTCLIQDRKSSNYHRCGRTDKGVSAFGQVISITVRSKLSEENQDNLNEEIKYCKILNKVLPKDIQCVGWCPIKEEFSARFDCQNRTYKYFFPRGSLDIEKMKTASLHLIGTHDFRNVCKMDVGNGVVQFTRNIQSIEIKSCFNKLPEDEYSMYVVTIKGRAFLWHQIRCIMGVLFLIGQDKEELEIISELLDVEKHSRKPEYNMANELPLNLYFCDYGENIQWQYDYETLDTVSKKLKEFWVNTSVKSAMIKTMLDDLEICLASCKTDNDDIAEKCLSEFLIDGVKAKKYTPVLKRQKCNSLEDKIDHFVKRNRLQVAQKE